ncbi:hypothetical protein O6H91_02G093000 [Diphasiastrum complanatum]|uniref:Uncharacterized protein n=1 Tax=Diphasiastrum complanatum TaxID=34168 RepID=A0ACC2EIL3_DIPCM|nr:hypothetical protein O6H91_02G093000 [Diphasiastrum complanatum]
MASGRRPRSRDYGQSDTSGTDDDLPASHSGRGSKEVRVIGNGREPTFFQPKFSNTEQFICKLEQDAYKSVLVAFGAQSENISWVKERLMTDLRKELRVSDEQHRELLGKVADDEILHQIQDWRRYNQEQSGCPPTNGLPYFDIHQIANISQSWKKLKTTNNPQAIASSAMPLPSSASKRMPIQRGIKKKGVDGFAEMQLIGHRVKTRWPEDNTFYEALIAEYNVEQGTHGLVYDVGTEKETWEWINLKEIAHGDLIWVEDSHNVVGKCLPLESVSIGQNGTADGAKKSLARSGVATCTGRVKGHPREHTAPFEKSSLQTTYTRARTVSAGFENSLNTKRLYSESLPLEALIEEIVRVEEEGDPIKLEMARKAVQKREEAICEALADVGDSSDEVESDEGHHLSSRTQSEDQQTGLRCRDDVSDHHGDSDKEGSTGDEKIDGSYSEPDEEQLAASGEEDDQHADGDG